jgi:hypothetical protein
MAALLFFSLSYPETLAFLDLLEDPMIFFELSPVPEFLNALTFFWTLDESPF